MLQCLPLGFCSVNYRVIASQGDALLDYGWSGDGAILYGSTYRISKEILCRRWLLTLNDSPVARAFASSFFTSSLTIEFGGSTFDLRRRFFSSTFTLERDGKVVGRFSRVHPFTRRGIIDCPPEVPELLQLFAFWLVAKIWRDSSSGDSGSTPGVT